MKSRTEYERDIFKKIIQDKLDMYDQECIAIMLRKYKREVLRGWIREVLNEKH